MTETPPKEPSAVARRINDNTRCMLLVTRKELASEGQLYESKWFDYRFLSPMEATIDFYELYQSIYKRKHKAYIDHEEAKLKRGVSAAGLFKRGAEFTSIWRARQFADELGVPYDIFLEAAIEHFFRSGWTRVPHPSQLSGQKNRERIKCAVMKSWTEHLDGRVHASEKAHYRTESFKGFHAQVEHRKWVLHRLREVHGKPYSVGRCCYIDRLITEHEALTTFGEDRLARARSDISGETPLPSTRSSIYELLPSCFAVCDAASFEHVRCRTCPARAACQDGANIVDRNLRSRLNSIDPIGDFKKRQLRKRVAKHRAKRKAMMAKKPTEDVIYFSSS